MIDFLKLYLHPNSPEYIAFITEDDYLEGLSLYQNIYIQYRNEQAIHLTYDWLYTASKTFKRALEDAINNQMKLLPEIKLNLGYEYNQRIYKSAHDKTIKISTWVGRKYLVIDSNGTTLQSGPLWMYNDKEGNIILEITPPFATLFFKKYSEEEPISFDEWMKDYQPLLVTTISKETAQQWVDSINNLITNIEKKINSMNITKFIISDTQYIQIIPEPIEKDACKICGHCDLYYIDTKKNISIRFGYSQTNDVCYFFGKYQRTLDLIDGKNFLYKNIRKDLGFKFNQFHAHALKKKEYQKVMDYYFQDNSHKDILPYFSSWLYNDKNGNVIFEISPFYPWFNEKNPQKNPEFITYSDFIKNYKIMVKTIIPKENLKKWIPQALKLKRSLGIHND